MFSALVPDDGNAALLENGAIGLAHAMQFRCTMSGALRTLAEWVLEHTDPAATRADPEPPAERVRQRKHTVLAIDDDPTFLHIATSALRKHGFDVLMSTTGIKGLNMLAYAPGDIEVVLLDYSMPQLNGAETLGHCASSIRTSK